MAIIPLNPTEENNEVSWYKSGAAGIVSGVLKVPEGIFSLAAELIDLGADTDTAASVEAFFDKLNPFEEVAEEISEQANRLAIHAGRKTIKTEDIRLASKGL